MGSKADEGFKNLNMNAEFFQRMLRRDNRAPPEYRDFDVYLMEKNLMPLLLQGLDALSRHIDKMHSKKNMDSDSRARFNPLVWLAQYLLRNHPMHCRDHRTPMYHDFSDMALIEKGRRETLRRKGQIEEAFHRMEKRVDGNQVKLIHIPMFIESLDELWNLEGVFVDRMPKDFRDGSLVKTQDGTSTGTVLFEDFWKWFEEKVEKSDVLRASDFQEAQQRKKEEERKAKRQAEEADRREERVKEMQAKRGQLASRFEACMAEIYLDEELNKIINQGAVLGGVEDEEGMVPVVGPHVQMIKTMMNLWGVEADMEAQADHWNDAALASWKEWLDRHSVADSSIVDADNLRALTDMDSFNQWLARAYPADESIEDGMERSMHVIKFIDDEIEYLAEVVDEETGETVQVSLPDEVAEEVRQRLEAEEVVMAKVDIVNNTITTVLPSESMDPPAEMEPGSFDSHDPGSHES
eukprot:gnl/MRDRNA2_/MRDRNA2_88686_c0_seq1.p1 gnl/MRDRNA2_/MRDRNA2_88686_c0~~gnl/MRDRNA2_/MRDRNA2_88686_c0_seq1.p1  ORF type:complete len:466 (-),score=127.47 gnl/MRDRNA2_/MRDRNA2_88686_c0_seq1:109-1506(-)